MFQDDQTFVLQCQKCQVNKHERLRKWVLHPLEICKGKWENIYMDFIIGLPRMNQRNYFVWVVVDRLTKMVQFIPTKKDVKMPNLDQFFIQHLYKLYILLANIVFDRDHKFDSNF